MKHLMLAMVEPIEGREAEFREWYRVGNIDAILGIDGFVSLQRFELSAISGNEGPFRFLALYEIEDGKLESVKSAWDEVQRERERAARENREPEVPVAPGIASAVRCYFTALTEPIKR